MSLRSFPLLLKIGYNNGCSIGCFMAHAHREGTNPSAFSELCGIVVKLDVTITCRHTAHFNRAPIEPGSIRIRSQDFDRGFFSGEACGKALCGSGDMGITTAINLLVWRKYFIQKALAKAFDRV